MGVFCPLMVLPLRTAVSISSKISPIDDNIEAEISVTGDLEGWLEDPWGPQYISDAAIGISRLWIKQLDAKLEKKMTGA
ncbi:hypothetical protein BTUL_0046g00260 [Botrytis tulipae]|uniref:Uncharacterized protein n=1 Tax=Botrytis tulipae TaxID=87230 RepID=A0A4Z1F1I0_9HELO|nr:hypothetical protein BTUL_0046g00260 [Botrytis tulipae]